MKQRTIGQNVRSYETQIIRFNSRIDVDLLAYVYNIFINKYMLISAYVCMSISCVLLLYWQVHQPIQNQFLAQQLDTVEGQIRAIELNPQGNEFRWLSDGVSIMVPKPTTLGIVTIHMWEAPQRVATAIQVGNHRIAMPAFTALQSRRLAILANTSTTTSTQLPISFIFDPNPTKDPIAWAFVSAHWSSALIYSSPQLQLVCFILFMLSIMTGTYYRISKRFYMSLTIATLGVLLVLFTPIPISLMVAWITKQPTFYSHLWVLLLAWTIWYWKHPNIMLFMRNASAQARVMMFVYGTLTLLPVIGMIVPLESPSMRIEELRKLQQCPNQWTGAIWDVAENFAPLSQCVTDNIGLRNTLIRIKNEIDYQVFGVSSRIYFGHNDFYFMRRWSDNRFPWLEEIFRTPTQRQKLLTTIQQINQQYAAHGIHVIMVIAPSKEFMYPENLPWNAPQYDYQMVRDFEQDMEKSGIDVIRTFDLLQAHKKDVPLLYHPRDFHWNDLAAYYVAHEITNRVAKHQQVTNPWQHPLDMCTMFRKASDQTFAALLSNRDAYAATHCQTTTMPNETPWIVEQRFNRDFNVWRATQPTSTQTLGAIEINGDSYSMYFQTSGFERYFNLVTITQFKNWRDAFSPAHLAYLQQNNIRYVVWQMRDASLPLVLNDIFTEY
jgi:hypothetical protein